jgi:hypothetical protein
MKTKDKLMLEEAIEKVLDRIGSDDNEYGMWHDTLHIQMASAAELVFDASEKSQIYYIEQMEG